MVWKDDININSSDNVTFRDHNGDKECGFQQKD